MNTDISKLNTVTSKVRCYHDLSQGYKAGAILNKTIHVIYHISTVKDEVICIYVSIIEKN